MPVAASRLATALLAGWATVLVASFWVVVRELGAEALVGASAHESESRSLAGVLLYPAHALRELPHLVGLALVWLAAVAPPRDGRELGAQLGRLALLTIVTGLALFAAAANEAGALAAWQDLAQTRAARGLEGPGAHFRFHLLSDLALAGIFYAAGRTVVGPAPVERAPGGRWLLALAGTLLLAALAAWGVDDVLSPRFVGHAGREVETSMAIVLPVLWALALRAPGATLEWRATWARRDVGVALAVAALAAGTLLAHALGVDLMAASSAPSRSVALNLATHHFEHLFDVAFLALAIHFALSAGRRAPAGRSRARD
jgi:hypothetical protein